jgi:iron(III) transport system substrate-binding protein
MSRRRIVIAFAGFAALVVAGLAGLVALTSGSGGADLVVYTARLHYGEEEVFRRFAEERGYDVKLFGGTGPALNERLAAEGADTEADVLITVDGANLREAADRGLLQPLRSPALARAVPAELRDPEGRWFGLTTRARTVMRSTERVEEGDVPSYASLGERRWRGRVCLRTSDSVYNSSFVADQIAKRGRAATERMLRAWMANEPRIYGTDVDALEAIAAGRCDLALTNSYYLARLLEEDADFPVAPVWVEQEGRGTHVNLSGFGIVRHAEHVEAARELAEYLVSPEAQALFAEINGEFPVNRAARLPAHVADWRGFEVDPIDAVRSAPLEDDAVELMNRVGWR